MTVLIYDPKSKNWSGGNFAKFDKSYYDGRNLDIKIILEYN